MDAKYNRSHGCNCKYYGYCFAYNPDRCNNDFEHTEAGRKVTAKSKGCQHMLLTPYNMERYIKDNPNDKNPFAIIINPRSKYIQGVPVE